MTCPCHSLSLFFSLLTETWFLTEACRQPGKAKAPVKSKGRGGQTRPEAHQVVFSSYLSVLLSKVTGEAAHGTRRGSGEGEEAAPIAFKLTPEQGGSSWGRAWVHSLRQSQEGRKRKEGREGEKEGRRTCNSSHTAGHTGKGGRETGMPNTLA